MTIKLGGTATFQVSVSPLLFPCFTLPLRNLSFLIVDFDQETNLMAPFLTVGL